MANKLTETDSKVIIDPLNEEFYEILSTWKQLLQSSFGPNGHPKLIQNLIGGHTTITTHFSRLIHTTKSSHPIMKLLLSSASNQEKHFSNFGMFTLLFSLYLIDFAWKLSLNTSLVADLFDEFGKILIEHLENDSCSCKIPVQLTSINSLKSIIKSILDSKPACMLASAETNYLTVLLLNAFYMTIPNANQAKEQSNYLGCVNIKTQEGLSSINSKVFQGLLLLLVDENLMQLHADNYKLSQNMKLALFNISLAGDSPSGLDAIYEFDNEDFAPEVLNQQQLKALAWHLVSNHVNIVACQKVIHPSLTAILHQHGILVIDRLGEENFQHLKYLSGAKPIASVIEPQKPEDFGLIQKIEIIHLYNKDYLHFQNANSHLCTVFLTNSSEESLEELKVTSKQVLDSLKLLLLKPQVLIGGGCLETHLSHILKVQVAKQLKDFESSGFGKGQVDLVLSAFISSLKAMSKALYPSPSSLTIDHPYYHLWLEDEIEEKETCACGLYSKGSRRQLISFSEIGSGLIYEQTEMDSSTRPIELQFQNMILDVSSAKINSFKIALETCTVLLKLGFMIIQTG